MLKIIVELSVSQSSSFTCTTFLEEDLKISTTKIISKCISVNLFRMSDFQKMKKPLKIFL